MFSSGASDLESVLRDVEPILRGNSDFQFAHPSFREVLAAKQFADEINSGKLSVRDAYFNFWSLLEWPKEWLLNKDFRTLRDDWKPILSHMAHILPESKKIELLETVSEIYATYRNELDSYLKATYPSCIFPKAHWNTKKDVMWFVEIFGGLHYLETRTGWICEEEFVEMDELKGHGYYHDFMTIFDMMERRDFNPELMKRFNEKISKAKNKIVVEIYQNCLIDFADHHINLYEQLEKKGVQFFDSEVYKPK